MFGLNSLGQGLAQLKGGPVGRARARERREQLRYAQHGIRWKVEDAKRAGIHPLYAIGGQAHSYKPQHVASQSPNINLARDIAAVKGKSTTDKALTDLNIQGMRLDNEYKMLKNTELKGLNNKRNMTNDLISNEPVTRNPPSPGNPGVEPGARSLEVIDVDKFGGIEFNLSQEAAESKESVGFIRKLQDMGYDTIRAAQMATNPKMRSKLKPLIITELRRTGRLKKNQTVQWSNALQRFVIRNIKEFKSRKPLIEFKKGYRKERNKREINEYWW